MLWRHELSYQGVGGLAATEQCVIVSDRDLADKSDVFVALNPTTGEQLWRLRYAAIGHLDYGNSPRATPLIHDRHAYLLGAFGQLHCVELDTGRIVWKRHIRRDFGADDQLVWGVASSPLIVAGKLIVNPGGPAAALVALNPLTGETLWQTAGRPAAFASFIVADVRGAQQLIGYDKTTLGGWNLADGRRLWQLAPPARDDFNVPTPLWHAGNLIVNTENNGARRYGFDAQGVIEPQPLAVYDGIASDTHTPVIVGNRLLGACGRLYCLDLNAGLAERWVGEDPAFEEYVTLIASEDRVLLTAQNGEVLLIDPLADACRIVSRWRLFDRETGLYSHPAIVGDRLFVRSSSEIVCVRLSAE